MRKVVLLFCFWLLSTTTAAAQSADPLGWVEFAPEGGGFSILFPNNPVETISKKTSYTLHSFTTTMGRGTYVATYSDYAQVKAEPAAFLEANRDRFNKGLQAKLISSREITLDGHTGLEFTSETPAANIKSQLFLIGNRMIQTATMVFKDVDQTKYVEKFFASFKFKK